MKYDICPICNRTISVPNYNRHLISHNNIKSKTYRYTNNLIYSLDHDTLICKFCNKCYKNKNSLVQHEIRCKLNPNKIDTSNSFNNKHRKRIAWNKGLNKNISPIIQKSIITYKENEALGKHHHVKHYSEEAKQRLRDNPNMGGIRSGSGYGKSGKYKGIHCDSTYELVFVIYCLDHNIYFKRNTIAYTYEYNGKAHKYYPDFEMSDNSLIEIKGFYRELVDIKAKAVTDKSLTILYKKDMQYMFDYVEEKYDYDSLTDLYD